MCLCAACFDQVCGYVLCAVFAYINAGVFFSFLLSSASGNLDPEMGGGNKEGSRQYFRRQL